MYNFAKYVGIPFKHRGRDFKGVDCYGLAFLIFREERNITLPDFLDIEYAYDWAKTGQNHILDNITEVWKLVEQNFQIFDLHLFRDNFGTLAHVGINIGDNRFLHCFNNLSVAVGSLDIWKVRMKSSMRYTGNA